MQLLSRGNALYQQSKYAEAIPLFQEAFELEKAEPQLDRTLWRGLIDSLGIAYGMTGHLKKAKATFEQGIQADPTYPMFHYNLACTFAEMNDLDHAMQSLTTAFRHRKNQNPGEEKMPDPRQKLSFQRFMKNDTFRNLVNNLARDKEHEHHKLKEGQRYVLQGGLAWSTTAHIERPQFHLGGSVSTGDRYRPPSLLL